MHRLSIAAFGIAFLTATAGCSGGGGGSTPPAKPAPTPTPAPVSPIPGGVPSPATLSKYQQSCTSLVGATAPPKGATNSSTYAIQSVPAGLAVSITGGTSASGVTPTSVVATQSNQAITIAIAPGTGAAPYVFSCDQRGDGNRTVLYNRSADTNGSIASISTSSMARTTNVARSVAQTADANVPRVTDRGALGRPAYSSTRLVVRYRNASLAAAGRRPLELERSMAIARGVDIGPTGGELHTRVVDVPAGTSIEALAASLRARPDVAYAMPERLYYKETTTAFMPNDTRFDNFQQWGEFEIQMPNAWGYTKGSSSVAIAVIDTGADLTHPEFAGKIAYQESVLNGVTSTAAGAAQDTDGHGSNVAGIAAMDTNDNFSYAGTGFNSSLQIYKVFSDGTAANKFSTSANSGDVTQAIYDAIAHGAKVINLSLGTCQVEGSDPLQRDAIEAALAANVTVVAASGNERSGQSGDTNCATASSTVDFPGAYDGVIAVGATTLDDSAPNHTPNLFATATERVASYSNSGPGLALVAPGGDPTSADLAAAPGTADQLHWIAGLYTSTAADPKMQCANKAECRALFAGTSQATPHVSGVAALMYAANPALTAAQVKTSLMATADDIGDPNQGAGRLNAYRALAAITGDLAAPKVPTNANFVAIAYVPNASTTPQIVDVTFPSGAPVASDGTFRVADIPANVASYKIGVWYDANGDGKVDAGDYFGSSGTCSAAAACASAAGIVVHPVGAGFVP